MIEKIQANSRTTEIHGTTRTCINAYQQSGLGGDPLLSGIIAKLNPKNEALGEAIDRSKAESILAEKDDVRDDACRAVGYLVQGYLYYPDEAIREAAATVKKVFDKYGFAVIHESYVIESSHIVSMLGDFAAPKIVTAIAKLAGVEQNISTLQTAENDFETTRAQFAKEEAEQNSLLNATQLKKEVIAILNDDLVPFLRYAGRFQAETYGTFVATIAEIIATNNEQVKKRRKKDDTSEEGAD